MSNTQTATQTATKWQIDPAHTQVEFTVKHMMFSKVRGRFEAVDGSLQFDPDSDIGDAGVRVTIDAASIDTGQEDRDEHLRSADFLDAEQYPQLTFASNSVEAGRGDEFTVTGDLTIHGVTREVEVDAELSGVATDPWGNERVAFSGSTTIDRRDFDLTWNQALETGGVLVGHEVNISLEVQATRSED
jgi:polyisoprenoid-binding protein YceI